MRGNHVGMKDRWNAWVAQGEAINEERAKQKYIAKQVTKNAKKSDPAGKPISQVGRSSADAVLACPKCGGTQFKAKRSTKGKAIGATAGLAGAMLAPKSRVKCETCGTEYQRG
jgi:hypothetical protein